MKHLARKALLTGIFGLAASIVALACLGMTEIYRTFVVKPTPQELLVNEVVVTDHGSTMRLGDTIYIELEEQVVTAPPD